MIPNPWHTVPDSHDVPNGRPVSIIHMSERLIFRMDGPVILYRRHRRDLPGAAGIPEKP